MTFEQFAADLERAGWRIWHLGQSTRGTWTCRLHCVDANERITPRGPAGFDREDIWREGAGPTALLAIVAAAHAIHQPRMEETLDLASMLA